MKHDFSWGDTRGIRKIMVGKCTEFLDADMPWPWCGYPPHEGRALLIRETRRLIKSLTGHDYKNVLITNGATHAINAYLYAVRSEYKPYLFTEKLHFSFYPGIAKMNHMIHKTSRGAGEPGITIIDSPSNPMGQIHGTEARVFFRPNVIWDAAYYSPTYCGIKRGDELANIPVIPSHEAMAGSFNKLTGLNGLRVGWLATDSDAVYSKALEYATNDVCGVSLPSQWAVEEILINVDLDAFYAESRALVDANRHEMARLHNIFGGQPIPPHGMFCLWEVDDQIKALLDRAQVKTMPGSVMGDDRDSVRFNLANENMDTMEMVRDILKADKI